LCKRNGRLTFEAYSDADYAGSPVDRRSTIGYYTFVESKWELSDMEKQKQNVGSRSFAESEFRSIAQGLCELL